MAALYNSDTHIYKPWYGIVSLPKYKRTGRWRKFHATEKNCVERVLINISIGFILQIVYPSPYPPPIPCDLLSYFIFEFTPKLDSRGVEMISW